MDFEDSTKLCPTCGQTIDDQDGICHRCLDEAEEKLGSSPQVMGLELEPPKSEQQRCSKISDLLEKVDEQDNIFNYCISCLSEFQKSIESCPSCKKELFPKEQAQELLKEELCSIMADWWFFLLLDESPTLFDNLLARMMKSGLLEEEDYHIEEEQKDFDPIFGYCTDFRRSLYIRGAKLCEVREMIEEVPSDSQHREEMSKAIYNWSNLGILKWSKPSRP